jgi:hypothetical protein
MRISTKAVRQIAKDSGFPEGFVEGNEGAFFEFVYRIAMRERKFCQGRIRAWHFDKNQGKCQLFDVLNSDDSEDYDFL